MPLPTGSHLSGLVVPIRVPTMGQLSLFFQWHINLCVLCNAKSILVEGHKWHLMGNRGVHAFCKDISLKVNVTARLEYELAYFHMASMDQIHLFLLNPNT